MTNYIFAIALLLLSTVGVVVRKTYNYVPFKELKRRAENNDPVASKLYPTAAYGNSMRALLWLFIVLTSAGGVVLLSREAPFWLSLIAVILLLWAAYSWLPASRSSGLGVKVTLALNPIILWLLGHLHPALERPAKVVQKRYNAPDHSGLYEKDDLVELIEKVQAQADSRFNDQELEIAKRALSFDDHTVNDILIPKNSVKSIVADDTVGPVLIDELHKSQQDHVLVTDTPKGNVVGTLNYKQLGLHSTGKVKDYMDTKVYFMHEDEKLSEALKTFFATNQSTFLVIDNSEEFVGIVTVEGLLKQLLGYLPKEDFDQYGNPAAVVARHQQKLEREKQEYEFIDEDEEPPTEHTSEEQDTNQEVEPEDNETNQEPETEEESEPKEKTDSEQEDKPEDVEASEAEDAAEEDDLTEAEPKEDEKDQAAEDDISISEEPEESSEDEAPTKIERVIDEEIDMNDIEDEETEKEKPKATKK